MATRLLSYKQLRDEKGIRYSRVQLWRLWKRGEFPAPIQIGPNRVAWREDEVDAFIEWKTSERDRLKIAMGRKA